MHKTTRRFRKCLERLPDQIRELAGESFELLKQNPRHPSLQLKKTGSFWSVRIGLGYRALAQEDGPDFIWLWIGTHDQYKRIISHQTRRRPRKT